MNGAHLHLLITHLPIFGSVLGALVLIHGLWTKNNQTKIAAYNLFIISAIGAVIAYLTGEAAEESVEHLPGVVEATIEAHEEFALVALISVIILGIASITGLILILRNSPYSRTMAFVILFMAFICFGITARTGFLGGQIRHTEITGDAAVAFENAEHNDD